MASWKDNFKKPTEAPPAPQKRAGICSNCEFGRFTLEIRKNVTPGRMARICRRCFEEINPDTGEILKRGEVQK